MNTRQLRNFIVLARLPSFSQAARELGIAQPALSQQIAALETELEVKLFERHARGARLTPEGERLLAHAEDLIRRLDGLKAELKVDAGAIVGTVSIGIAGGIASYLAPSLIQRVEQDLPLVQLEVSEALSFRLRRQVEEGQLDLAIVPSDVADTQSLHAERLFRQTFRVFGTRHLLGDDDRPLSLQQIAELPLASTDRSHDLRKRADFAAREAEVQLDVRYEINSVGIINGLVAAGCACAILPEQGFRRTSDMDDIVVRKIAPPSIFRWQSIIRRHAVPETERVGAVVDCLRHIIDETGLRQEV